MQYSHWIRTRNVERYNQIPNNERGSLVNDLLEAHWAKDEGAVFTHTSADLEAARKEGFADGYGRGRYRGLDDMRIELNKQMHEVRREHNISDYVKRDNEGAHNA